MFAKVPVQFVDQIGLFRMTAVGPFEGKSSIYPRHLEEE